MDINYLRENNLILLEAISGSRAYGLNTPSSDTDIKGVFILPRDQFYSLEYTAQVNNESNDIVFYELGRFIELLSVNNPNILELLNSPKDALIYKHPLLDQLDSSRILSTLCKDTFGGFAFSQIKKARGLKKKIINPVDKERKSILDFCYVNHNNGSVPLLKFLALKNFNQSHCGLVNIAHMPGLYGLYHSEKINYKGIAKSSLSDDISLSSIPKGEPQIGLLYFNKDGYSTYCKSYKEYWDWVEKRNEARYQNTIDHGKNYDAKNMMHTFRLLEMAIEIGEQGIVNVKRTNRDFLLDIKHGNYEYEALLTMASERQQEMVNAFENSSLKSRPDLEYLNQQLIAMRAELYQKEQFQ